MAYTGTDPDLIDLQNQITTNLNAQHTAVAGMQTQIKQAVLSLEGSLAEVLKAFATLKAYVLSKIPN